MATIRELVTKLTTKADLSGVKKTLAAVKKTGQAILKTDKKTRDSATKTSNLKANKAVMAMKEQIKAIKKAFKAQKKIDKASLKNTRAKLKAEVRATREAGRAKIKQIRKEVRMRRRAQRSSGRGGARVSAKDGGGGLGLGSIISGNVIANAITAGFRSAAQAVKDFAFGMIDAAANIEKVQAEFGVMLGSGERALVLISELKKKGAETPLQFKDLAKNARILLQYGSSAENVVEQLTMIGDVVGGDRARFDFMSFAFAQMRSAGKLMGQELRQMVNAGFNPLEQMMKTTGLTMNQLRKEMEMGTISSDDVTEAFKQATSSGGRFFNNMQVQAKTLTGRISTMRDEIFMMMEAMGQRLLPGVKKAVNTIIAFVKGPGRKIGINLLDSMLPAINAIISGFDRFIKTLFNVNKIGKTLMNKKELGKFFEDLAKKIDKASIFITAVALSLKEFASEIAGPMRHAFDIMVTGIQLVMRHLPTLLKFWIGFKAFNIARALLATANGIIQMAMALRMLAMTNPLLLTATAALVAMGIAAKRIFDSIDERKSHEARMKQAQDLNAQAEKRLKLLKAQSQAEANLQDKLEAKDLTASKRARLQERLENVQTKKGEIAAEVRALSQASVKALTGKPQESSLVGDLKSLFDKLTGLETTSASGAAFDKKLEEIRKTQVVQNFFIKSDVNTTVQQSIPEGKDSRDIGKAAAAAVKTQINKAMDAQFTKIIAATAS